MLVAVIIWYFVIWYFAIIHRVKQHIDTSETGHCLVSKIGWGNLFLPFWCTEVRVTVTSVKWTEAGYSPCPVGHPLHMCTPICHLLYGRSTFATPAMERGINYILSCVRAENLEVTVPVCLDACITPNSAHFSPHCCRLCSPAPVSWSLWPQSQPVWKHLGLTRNPYMCLLSGCVEVRVL